MIQTIENIALAALASLETCKTTYAVCRQALEEGIPGDFVECGVYAGSQAAIMAKALIGYGSKPTEYQREGQWSDWHLARAGDGRRVHLFDSFEGIPEPGKQDTEYLLAGHRAGTASCTFEGVKSNMKQWGIPEELLVYHPGWFKDTLAEEVIHWARVTRISVLRLDADLYNSTMTCLKYLYPLLSPGGFLIVDDYALSGARQAVEDYFDHVGGRGPITMRKS
jgi:O-methyltransferase